MFIVVRYGNDEKLLFNPMCRIANLLADIRERCNLEHIDMKHIDLCDETGIAKDLPRFLENYGSQHLNSPGTYVVLERKRVAIERLQAELNCEDDDSDEAKPMDTVYTSLLNNSEKLLPGFCPRSQVQKVTNHKDLRKAKRGKELQLDKGLLSKSTPSPIGLKSVSNMKLKGGKSAKAVKGKR